MTEVDFSEVTINLSHTPRGGKRRGGLCRNGYAGARTGHPQSTATVEHLPFARLVGGRSGRSGDERVVNANAGVCLLQSPRTRSWTLVCGHVSRTPETDPFSTFEN
jgi:hypothetical protein